ncbi:MAG: glycoside hydrolase family 5 protein [bacterium]|nr:glycoside hydrolase family 5 protein [bacterium]
MTGCDLKPEDPSYITDLQGRALILHGLNTSSNAKGDPLRMPWITEADVQRASKEWGFNFVRFLIFWDGIEPEKGVFDEAYLDRVAERIEWYADAGMYVMLDMHQDLYALNFGGDGAPEWAQMTDGLPAEPQSPWWLTYLQPGVTRAFDNFWNYNKHPDLQDHYAMAWKKVAERFKDYPNVIGYDLMNEPYGGSWLWPVFEAFQLKPFYERVIASIRSVDEDRWIFYEPQAFGVNFGIDSTLGTPDDPRDGENRLVYAPHFYPVDVHEGKGYNGDMTIFNSWADSRSRELNAQKAPLVLGEFGLNPNQDGSGLFLDNVMTMMDRMGGGWAYWSDDPGGWGPVDAAGNETGIISHIVRTYPQRIAGHPLSFSFDPGTREFILKFRNKEGVTGPTEIYIPAKRHYSDGWKVKVSDPAGSWFSTWDENREVLSVTTDPGQDEHSIRIIPSVFCKEKCHEEKHGCDTVTVCKTVCE